MPRVSIYTHAFDAELGWYVHAKSGRPIVKELTEYHAKEVAAHLNIAYAAGTEMVRTAIRAALGLEGETRVP